MNASADMSIVTLVMNASPVVQCVLAILVIASLASWATIFSKWIVLSRTLRQTDEFEQRFWSGANLTKLLVQPLRAPIAQVPKSASLWPA